MTLHVDLSLWPIVLGYVFVQLFPWGKEIVDRLVPKAPDGASLKKLEGRIGDIELAVGMRKL